MDINLLDDFTLADCHEYLAKYPDGKHSQKVKDLMEHMINEANRLKSEFNTEFNRYFATQRYEDAYAHSLKYLNEVNDPGTALEKTDKVIPKLNDRIQIPVVMPVTYDWLIDQLVLKGYGEMTYTRNQLSWKMSSIRISNVDETTVITSTCRINKFMMAILVVLAFAMSCLAGGCICAVDNDEVFILAGFVVGIICFALLMYRLSKLYKQSRDLLHVIANIVVENLYNKKRA